MRKLVLLALLGGAALGCNDTTAPSDNAADKPTLSAAKLDLRDLRASLIDAGNAVSRRIQANGIPDALGNAFANKVLFLSSRVNTIQGRDAAVDFLRNDPIAPSALDWEVIFADVSSDGSQGYTWSQGSFTIDIGAGATTFPGFFLIYWRRGGGGAWRIEAMTYNAGEPWTGPLPDGFGTPDTRKSPEFPGSVERLRRAVRNTDENFAAASVKHGSGPAFERFAAPNAIIVGGPLVFGPEAIGVANASGPNDVINWGPRFSDVAESGDLGFSVGDATFDLEGIGQIFTKYLTVWRRQPDGRWRYVADLGNRRATPE
jgi:ketosteroid isomerase-like protein